MRYRAEEYEGLAHECLEHADKHAAESPVAALWVATAQVFATLMAAVGTIQGTL